jgi:hypothetical protein
MIEGLTMACSGSPKKPAPADCFVMRLDGARIE